MKKEENVKNDIQTPSEVQEAEVDGFGESEKSQNNQVRSTFILVVLVLNAIVIILLFVFLNLIAKKANELNTLNNEIYSLDKKSEADFAQLDLTINKDKADSISMVFPDEEGLIEFVQFVESLKVEGRTLKEFYFANEDAVRDATRSLGIPIVLEFEGSIELIDRDLEEIYNLRYLIKPYTIKVERKISEPDVFSYKIGGFIYVDDEFEKN